MVLVELVGAEAALSIAAAMAKGLMVLEWKDGLLGLRSVGVRVPGVLTGVWCGSGVLEGERPIGVCKIGVRTPRISWCRCLGMGMAC